MIQRLFVLQIHDKFNSDISLINHVVMQELSFLSMENDWKNTYAQFDRIEIKSNPYNKIIYFNVFGNGVPIEELS